MSDTDARIAQKDRELGKYQDTIIELRAELAASRIREYRIPDRAVVRLKAADRLAAQLRIREFNGEATGKDRAALAAYREAGE